MECQSSRSPQPTIKVLMEESLPSLCPLSSSSAGLIIPLLVSSVQAIIQVSNLGLRDELSSTVLEGFTWISPWNCDL